MKRVSSIARFHSHLFLDAHYSLERCNNQSDCYSIEIKLSRRPRQPLLLLAIRLKSIAKLTLTSCLLATFALPIIPIFKIFQGGKNDLNSIN